MSNRPAANDPIPLTLAARSAGIPARTLRNWIASGKLAAIRGQRGWLVRLGDIAQIAAMIDTQAASEKMAAGMAAGLAAELAAPAQEDPDDAAIAANSAAIAATDQRTQAEALIQQLLAPFIVEQTRLAEELGQVKAERDAKDATIVELRRRAALAEAALLRPRDEGALSHQRDVERVQVVLDPARTTEEASGNNPSPEASAGFWARVRRVFGGAG